MIGDIPSGLCECGCGAKTNLATQNHTKYGYVKGRPMRFVKGHQGRIRGTRYVIEDRGHTTPCWIWQFGRSGNGYARFDARRNAHVVFYEEAYGPVPSGLHLDHLCRNPACVNPDHLEPVTNAENIRRGAGTKLTWDDVRAIRRSSAPNQSLADRFGVTPQHIARIKRRVDWVAA